MRPTNDFHRLLRTTADSLVSVFEDLREAGKKHLHSLTAEQLMSAGADVVSGVKMKIMIKIKI